jgi:hypothetical protein
VITISLSSLLDKARKLLGVGAAYVGIVGEPSEFFEVASQLIGKGKKKDFLQLLTEENPIARAMGIVCLVRTEGIKSKDIIKPHLKDRTTILSMPGGCTLIKTTLGAIVWDFFNNINYLGFDVEIKPLLPERELISLNLEMLSGDQYSNFHWKASRKLIDALKNNKIDFLLANLQNICASLSLEDIVKGIGRIKNYDLIREFLRDVVKNKDLNVNTRLAASSALTREINAKNIELLKDWEQFFNEKSQNAGTLLLRSIHLKEKINELKEILFKEHSWDWLADHKKEYLRLISISHPHALYYLKSYGLSYIDDYPEMKKNFINLLFKLINLTPELDQSWNTYSNLPYQIEFLVYGPREAEVKKILGEQKYAKLVQLIESYTENK